MASASSSPSSSSSYSSTSPPRYYSPTINQMDQDHLISILLLLPLDSIISFSMTCRRFRSLASSNTLWEEICRRDWGRGVVDALVSSSSQHRREFCWNTLYQRISQMGLLSCRRLSTKDEILPSPRASHSLNFVSDNLVLFGGGCEGGRHLDDTWVAHIGNGVDRVLRWRQVNSGTPSGRFGHTCTILGKVLVLFGGINDNGIRHNDTWVGEVIQEESSVTRISWSLLDVEPILPPARGAHAACYFGDRQIVIHGGIGLYGLRLNDTWLLELSNSLRSARWQQIAHIQPSPPPRSGHSITWIGDKRIVLFGGRGSGYEVLNDLWILDLGVPYPEWNELKYDSLNIPGTMPLPRVGHSATTILGGKVLIYGGEDSQRHRKDDFWVLDVGALSRFQATGLENNLQKMWKKLGIEGHCPNCRSFHGACTDRAGLRLFVFGGMVDNVVHPAEGYGLRFDGELYLVELVF